jgi:hypothetical protein
MQVEWELQLACNLNISNPILWLLPFQFPASSFPRVSARSILLAVLSQTDTAFSILIQIKRICLPSAGGGAVVGDGGLFFGLSLWWLF